MEHPVMQASRPLPTGPQVLVVGGPPIQGTFDRPEQPFEFVVSKADRYDLHVQTDEHTVTGVWGPDPAVLDKTTGKVSGAGMHYLVGPRTLQPGRYVVLVLGVGGPPSGKYAIGAVEEGFWKVWWDQFQGWFRGK